MADELPEIPAELTGAKKLIAALTEVYNLEDELFDWAHLEEHFFEFRELDKLAGKFDKAVNHARSRRRVLLDRLFALGGQIDGVETEPIPALEEWLTRLRSIHKACQAAYDACEFMDGEEDYVTMNLLRDNQECIEAMYTKVAAKLAYYQSIGPQLTLTELE